MVFPCFSSFLQGNRADVISRLKSLRSENRQFSGILSEKTKEIKPLQQALGKLRNSDGAGGNGGICSSENQLNELVCFKCFLCTKSGSTSLSPSVAQIIPLLFLFFLQLP